MLLVIVGVVNKDNKVDSEVKLEFLCLEVLFKALFRGLQKLLPRFEEIIFLALIKAHRESVQELGRILNWSATSLAFQTFQFSLKSFNQKHLQVRLEQFDSVPALLDGQRLAY